MSVRIDKWLWSVRIYKSRTKATDACRAGHISMDGRKLKSSEKIEPGMVVQVKKEGFNFQYEVVKLIEKRVGAPIAMTCYNDVTPKEELNKYKLWYSMATARPEFRERGEGRPTKKDRRSLEQFKEDIGEP